MDKTQFDLLNEDFISKTMNIFDKIGDAFHKVTSKLKFDTKQDRRVALNASFDIDEYKDEISKIANDLTLSRKQIMKKLSDIYKKIDDAYKIFRDNSTKEEAVFLNREVTRFVDNIELHIENLEYFKGVGGVDHVKTIKSANPLARITTKAAKPSIYDMPTDKSSVPSVTPRRSSKSSRLLDAYYTLVDRSNKSWGTKLGAALFALGLIDHITFEETQRLIVSFKEFVLESTSK